MIEEIEYEYRKDANGGNTRLTPSIEEVIGKINEIIEVINGMRVDE